MRAHLSLAPVRASEPARGPDPAKAPYTGSAEAGSRFSPESAAAAQRAPRTPGRRVRSGGRGAPWRRPEALAERGSVRRSPRAARGGASPYIARGPRRPGWLLPVLLS